MCAIPCADCAGTQAADALDMTNLFPSIDPSALNHVTGGKADPPPSTHKFGAIFRVLQDAARDDYREAHGRNVTAK